MTNIETFNLDSRQLARIEAVHRGFLYQHLVVRTTYERITEGDEWLQLNYLEEEAEGYNTVERGEEKLFVSS
jgi:hypothetical protein